MLHFGKGIITGAVKKRKQWLPEVWEAEEEESGEHGHCAVVRLFCYGVVDVCRYVLPQRTEDCILT
jgi:hypothetical protein